LSKSTAILGSKAPLAAINPACALLISKLAVLPADETFTYPSIH
jgi:hypothetical protein